MFDLTSAISRLNLNIGSAHIVTFGEKAVDAFYVTDLTGLKITNPARQGTIRRQLLESFDSSALNAPKTAIKRQKTPLSPA